jgi:hypothetical protein
LEGKSEHQLVTFCLTMRRPIALKRLAMNHAELKRQIAEVRAMAQRLKLDYGDREKRDEDAKATLAAMKLGQMEDPTAAAAMCQMMELNDSATPLYQDAAQLCSGLLPQATKTPKKRTSRKSAKKRTAKRKTAKKKRK